MSNKVDGFIRVFDGTGCLVLFGNEKYDYIYNRIRYLISQKRIIRYAFLIIRKNIAFVIALLKSGFNRNQNQYCFNIFFEKKSCGLAEK